MTATQFLDVLEEIITSVIAPQAHETDASAKFPREAVDALGAQGLLGLTSSVEVGGMGLGLAEAAQVVRSIAAACGSTAMVVCMHYCATTVIEQFGNDETRRAIASGNHLSTLAFSESGSRSHFWAPLGTATVDGDVAQLNAHKSWITSAGEADSYVWTSQSVDGQGASLWLVPSTAPGLVQGPAFDGLGLRGNASTSVVANNVNVSANAGRLGDDGSGLGIALGVVLPVFQILSASCSLGIMDASVAKAIAHVTTARLEHLDQTLSDQAVTRQHVADMKARADTADTLVADAIGALRADRPDAALRMLQSKLVAGEAALAVLDVAMRLGGGAAFRKDIGIDRHFRDVRASTVMAPTSDALREFIGRALCGMPLFD